MKAVNHSWWIGAIISTILTFIFFGKVTYDNIGMILFIGIVNGVFWGWIIGLIIDKLSESIKGSVPSTNYNEKVIKKNEEDSLTPEERKELYLGYSKIISGHYTTKKMVTEKYQQLVDNSLANYSIKNETELSHPILGPLKLMNFIDSSSEEIKISLLKNKELLGFSIQDIDEIVIKIHKNLKLQAKNFQVKSVEKNKDLPRESNESLLISDSSGFRKDNLNSREIIIRVFQEEMDNSLLRYKSKNLETLNDPIFGPMKIMNFINISSEEFKKSLMNNRDKYKLSEEEINEIIKKIHSDTLEKNLH